MGTYTSEYRKLLLMWLQDISTSPGMRDHLITTIDECVKKHVEGCPRCDLSEAKGTYDYCVYNFVCSGNEWPDKGTEEIIEAAVLAWKLGVSIYPLPCLALHSMRASYHPWYFDKILLTKNGPIFVFKVWRESGKWYTAICHPSGLPETKEWSTEWTKGDVKDWNMAVAEYAVANPPTHLLEFGWRRGANYQAWKSKALAVLEGANKRYLDPTDLTSLAWCESHRKA